MSDVFDILVSVDRESLGIKSDNRYLLVNGVHFHKDKLPCSKIVILGVGEGRGLTLVRKSLYGLYYRLETGVTDLGNIPPAENGRLQELLKILSDDNKTVILIGNSMDVLPVCLDSLADRESISASVVSPALVQSGFTDSLFSNRFRNLFDFNCLAYQTYLSDPGILRTFSSRYFETLRLGKFRENRMIYEPALRSSDILSLDLASIRKSEAADSLYSGLNGLYLEEICRISRYAGISDNLKIANVFCRDKIEKNGQKNEIIAQIVWHIIDGITNRADEIMLNNVNRIKKFLINLEQPEEQLIFYHSDITNRWWMEIRKDSETSPLIIPCMEEDYKMACRHDVPLRWIWYHQKVMEKN
ncbi:MAG: hypothetical protein LBK58_11115 [Prevotellaceae bacterium]|jgi:hypothetical protein|nr:hypothetical protein [Prevotellaceae bacterium]